MHDIVVQRGEMTAIIVIFVIKNDSILYWDLSHFSVIELS